MEPVPLQAPSNTTSEIAWWVHPGRCAGPRSSTGPRSRAAAAILSIGCGPALHEATIAGLPYASVVATDLDPEEIATARKVAHRMGVENGIEHRALKAEELGPIVSQERFDRIISLAVLHDIGDLSGAMKT